MELTVAPHLLAEVKLEGRVVTGDALYAQRELSRRVVEGGGDYLWVIKDNQPALKAALALLFQEPPWGEVLRVVEQVGQHGDRWERRQLWASTGLNDYLDWPYLGQVCCVERTRRRKGVTEVETSYAVTSLTPEKGTAQRLLALWRGHWRIENQSHYVRDVTMKEDGSQVRSGAAPEVMAALRNVVLGLLRQSGVTNVAAALRRYSWKVTSALALLGLVPP